MKRTVWKYPFDCPDVTKGRTQDRFAISVPKEHQILHVCDQGSGSWLWILVDPATPNIVVDVVVMGTHVEIDSAELGAHIATWQSSHFVWHMFHIAPNHGS